MATAEVVSMPNSVNSAQLAPPQSCMIAAEDLWKTYDMGSEQQVHALRGVNLRIQRNEYVAIMGPSGSGKSTLLHCLAGLDTLTSGHVYLGDLDMSALSDKELTRVRRDRIGFIFQSYNLIPTLNAEENITLPLSIAGEKADPEFFRDLVEKVGLADRLHHRPAELSGGQQQRVAIARALVSKPTLLFADEPTGNLDSATGTEILALMRDSVDSYGQTTVMVTHEPRAAAIADRILFLADGVIVRDLPGASQAEVLATLTEIAAA